MLSAFELWVNRFFLFCRDREAGKLIDVTPRQKVLAHPTPAITFAAVEDTVFASLGQDGDLILEEFEHQSILDDRPWNEPPVLLEADEPIWILVAKPKIQTGINQSAILEMAQPVILACVDTCLIQKTQR